jgi:hypothetical protein
MAQTRRLYQEMVSGGLSCGADAAGRTTHLRERGQAGGNEDRLEQALQRLEQIEESVEQARVELRQATELIRTLAGYGRVNEGSAARSAGLPPYKTVHWPS